MNKPARRKSQQASRRGTSAVEFAVVAPILFVVLLALIQFSSLLMSKNVLTSAAREGARVIALPSTVSSANVVAAVEDRLQKGGIDPNLATVTINPAFLVNVSTGDEMRVTVSVPIQNMAWIWAVTPPNANMSTEITCERE